MYYTVCTYISMYYILPYLLRKSANLNGPYFVKRQLQVRYCIEEKGHDESNGIAQKFLLHMLRFFECIWEFLWSPVDSHGVSLFV